MALQLQSIALGSIVVSPDGNTIAYWGRSDSVLFICYYHDIDGVYYSFDKVEISETSIDYNSLQFINNFDLYFTSANDSSFVFHLRFEESYCENALANDYLPHSSISA